MTGRCLRRNPDQRALSGRIGQAAGEGLDVEDRRRGLAELDGIDGWIFERCEPEPACIPEGAERVYRYYNGHRDDFAIFPESELAQKQAEGYGPTGGELAPVIGYAYPNVDTDGDNLIDGFERILGTDPQVADTDCDGVSDGEEVHLYDRSNPDPTKRGYGDPLDGSCTDIFADGFESGILCDGLL